MLTALSCSQAPQSAGDAALSVIMNRKSVRSFTGDKLSEDQLTTILKAAMAAPTDKNNQPWQFIVVSDDEAKAAIPGADRGAAIRTAGAVIIVCGKTTMERVPRDNPAAEPETVPNNVWFLDCSAATENLLLAAEASGLGAVWFTCYPNERKSSLVREAFAIPEGIEPFAIVPVGVPAEDNAPKDKWNPDKIHYNRW